MPSGHQWMSRGDVVRVALRFHAWSSGCRNGAGGWHCSSPSRGPFGGLFLASTCFGLRARVAHTRSVERWFKLQLVDAQETEQNDGRRGEAAVLAHSTARLSMDRLERSLLLTRACVTNDGRVVEWRPSDGVRVVVPFSAMPSVAVHAVPPMAADHMLSKNTYQYNE